VAVTFQRADFHLWGDLDYLLYGRMYIPTSQLDGLYARRLGPTLLSQISFVSFPSESSSVSRRARSNLTFGLQHDTGRWSSEYSYSVGDGMLGARVMHNFGQLQGTGTVPGSGSGFGTGGSGGPTTTSLEKQQQQQQRREKRVDEEESLGKGLRGRFSAGAEIFFSALEKSGGGMFLPFPLQPRTLTPVCG
jgi:distribution and morphology protein 10